MDPQEEFEHNVTRGLLPRHNKESMETLAFKEKSTDHDITINYRHHQQTHQTPMVKEESSDDSTIISSQTSTLTRNQDCESFQPKMNMFEELVNCLGNTEAYDSEESDEEEEEEEDEGDEEEGITVEFRPNDRLEVVVEDCDHENMDEKYLDKQTNTECAFYPEHAKQMKINASTAEDRSLIKRSQTFSPAVSKNHYICKLNRSDSDSAMPLYRKGNNPFQRNAVERRSLRCKKPSGSLTTLSTNKSQQSHLPTTARTSLDLELDLQAQQTRLHMLNTELTRLRDLKQRLETAKERGDTELASWVLEDKQFQCLVAQAENEKQPKTPEEKKVEKMLRKVSQEIYKLRKTKAGNGKPDIILFREKMAFFTRVNTSIPFLPNEQIVQDEATTNKDDKKQYSSSETDETEKVDKNENETQPSTNKKESTRYDYVVDRVLGVEV